MKKYVDINIGDIFVVGLNNRQGTFIEIANKFEGDWGDMYSYRQLADDYRHGFEEETPFHQYLIPVHTIDIHKKTLWAKKYIEKRKTYTLGVKTLYSEEIEYGTIGMLTHMKDRYGKCLRVGDIVSFWYIDENANQQPGVTIVVYEETENRFYLYGYDDVRCKIDIIVKPYNELVNGDRSISSLLTTQVGYKPPLFYADEKKITITEVTRNEIYSQ